MATQETSANSPNRQWGYLVILWYIFIHICLLKAPPKYDSVMYFSITASLKYRDSAMTNQVEEEKTLKAPVG